MSRVTLGLVLVIGALVSGGCGGGSDGPSTPTAPSSVTPTRTIAVSGDLTYGEVRVGESAERTMTVRNTGNAQVTVSGMTVTGGLANILRATWTRGTIPAGGSQTVHLRVEPSTAGAYSGTVTVNGDHSGGGNVLPVSLRAVGVHAGGTFQGRYVVERCDGTGSIQDLLCSANRGLYPVGASLPVRLTLTQSGDSVSGRVEFGQLTGAVFGSISPSGVLSLQGTATSGDLTIVIASWATPIVGDSLAGAVRLDISARSIFGVAAITARLADVRR